MRLLCCCSHRLEEGGKRSDNARHEHRSAAANYQEMRDEDCQELAMLVDLHVEPAQPAEPSGPADQRSGFISKRMVFEQGQAGSIARGWKLRFFTLSDLGVLSYHESELDSDEGAPLRAFHLASCSLRLDDGPSDAHERTISISIGRSGRMLQLRFPVTLAGAAEGELEVEQWASSLALYAQSEEGGTGSPALPAAAATSHPCPTKRRRRLRRSLLRENLVRDRERNASFQVHLCGSDDCGSDRLVLAALHPRSLCQGTPRAATHAMPPPPCRCPLAWRASLPSATSTSSGRSASSSFPATILSTFTTTTTTTTTTAAAAAANATAAPLRLWWRQVQPVGDVRTLRSERHGVHPAHKLHELLLVDVAGVVWV
jgi:hypothetical protein